MGRGGSKVLPAQPLNAVLPAGGSDLAKKNAQKTHAQKAASVAYISLRTIEITIKKTDKNDRIGLNGAPSTKYWSVLDIGNGLVARWNEQHPDLVVEEGDIIVACNGVKDDGELICDAMKNDMDLSITVAKSADAPSERRQTTLKNTPESGVQETPEAVTTSTHSETKLADVHTLQDVGQGAKVATFSMEMLEEQALPNHDILESARKSGGSMCCSGPKTCK